MNARLALALSTAFVLATAPGVQAHAGHQTAVTVSTVAVASTAPAAHDYVGHQAMATASTVSVASPAPSHRVTVNGKALGQLTVFEDRLYVPADAFAAAIGGALTQENGVTRIGFGGFELPSFAKLSELNPALTKYQALSPFIPSMGIHMGVQGPGLIVCVTNEGAVNAVEILVPAAAGWAPWFDQPKDQPMAMEGLGEVYSQHVYVTDPAGIVEQNAGEPVLIGGRYLSTGYNLKAHKVGETLYIPLRPAVELLGGTIDWNGADNTATVSVDYKGISYAWLQERNPALTTYQPLSEFVPNMGFHNGVPGPHVTVLTDSAAKVVGFELVTPAVAGWAPWFDQPENQSFELPGLGQVYTQHIYLVDPNTIK